MVVAMAPAVLMVLCFDEPPPTPLQSNPYAPLAQGIEQLPSKQWVAGSNPAGGASLFVVMALCPPSMAGTFAFATEYQVCSQM